MSLNVADPSSWALVLVALSFLRVAQHFPRLVKDPAPPWGSLQRNADAQETLNKALHGIQAGLLRNQEPRISSAFYPESFS